MSSTELEPVSPRNNEAITETVTSAEALQQPPISPPPPEPELIPPSNRRSAALMATLTCASFLNTFNSGTLTVALPSIATDLNIPDGLLLWPASVYALGLSCALLLAGAVADVVGSRPVFLLGSGSYAAATLAVGLARSAAELVGFRALQGVAMALCMPAAVGVITSNFPSGRLRNVAFAAFGGGSPLGFATGLVLGGVFAQVSGWRTAFYMAAAINAATTLLAWFTLPATAPVENMRHRFVHGFDWVGLVSANACLAMLSYIFAQVTHGERAMAKPYNIALLVAAVLLVPFFVFWVGRQERLGRPAIISNSVWRRREFATVCVTVFLVWSWFNAFGYWTTLFFQVVQGHDALGAALRFLPMVTAGVLTNLAAGLLMDRVPAGRLVLVGGLLSTASPLLFAVQRPEWPYWAAGFPAMCLSVVSIDLLFNVSNLVITSSFPSKDQALAGGIFNTVTQLGNSVGPAVTAMIASSVTRAKMGDEGISKADATLDGYRSAFWACFGLAVVSVVVGAVGLRKAGKVGMKKD